MMHRAEGAIRLSLIGSIRIWPDLCQVRGLRRAHHPCGHWRYICPDRSRSVLLCWTGI